MFDRLIATTMIYFFDSTLLITEIADAISGFQHLRMDDLLELRQIKQALADMYMDTNLRLSEDAENAYYAGLSS